jgi:succinyl-diaminopimelate desuccinylase
LSQQVFTAIDDLRHEMIETLMALIRLPAVGPENGGDGELAKAEFLVKLLKDAGFDRVERYDTPDSRVKSKVRPNVVAYLEGEVAQKLWIVTHMDVVPAGELSLWKTTKPFEPLLSQDKIYGRGSEDNGQSLVASIYAAKALKTAKIKPKYTLALAFVADEEQGSNLGIQHLIQKNLFGKGDLVIVPDSGVSNGSFIEIAEKSILWFKIRTIGKQAHGSRPNDGLNAHRIGMQVALALDTMLHEKYFFRDLTFDPPECTFEMTKKEANVEAVNMIPGEDVFYFDCRLHPTFVLDEVVCDINNVLSEYIRKTGAKIEMEILQMQQAPAFESGNSQIATMLKKAIKQARGIDASLGGIGGGSCAAFFRKMGIPAVVWSTIDEVAHQPDEYAKVSNMVADAKVFASLALM